MTSEVIKIEEKGIVENNQEISSFVEELKKDDKEIYERKKRKLPKKDILVQNYLDLCAEKGVEPEHSRIKLEKQIKKDIIADMIDELKCKTQNEDLKNSHQSVKQPIKVTANLKKSVANFLFHLNILAVSTAESFTNSRPNLGISLDGYTAEIISGKKEITQDLYNIVNCYPQIARWFNPILVHSTKMLNTGIQVHNNNMINGKIPCKKKVEVRSITANNSKAIKNDNKANKLLDSDTKGYNKVCESVVLKGGIPM